jgi:GGDEF domain-containing protein
MLEIPEITTEGKESSAAPSRSVSPIPDADSTSSDVIRRADERLYDAKRAGKNRYSA